MLWNICLVSWWKYAEYSIFWQHSSRPNRINVAPKMIYSKATMVNRIRLNQNPGQPEKSKKWYIVNTKSKILGKQAVVPPVRYWAVCDASLWYFCGRWTTWPWDSISTFRYPGVLLLLIFSCCRQGKSSHPAIRFLAGLHYQESYCESYKKL